MTLSELAEAHGLQVAYVAEVICPGHGFYRLATARPLNGCAACPTCGRQAHVVQFRGRLATRKRLPLVDRVTGAVNQQVLRAIERALEPPCDRDRGWRASPGIVTQQPGRCAP